MKLAIASLLGGLLLSLPAAAQTDLQIVVRPGDTDQSLTRDYLSTPGSWDTLVRYNALLKPGNIIKAPRKLCDLRDKAVLSLVYGQVYLRPAGMSDWIIARSGLIVQKGDRIRTALYSGAELTMANGDKAVLRQLTEIGFEPYSQPPRGKTTLLRVLRGRLISTIRKLKNRDTRYEIQTPTATSLVRGTIFRTKVDDDLQTQFEVLRGAVKVSSQGEERTVKENYGIKILNSPKT
jgi:hypothetical protein